jgi:6-phosphogluconolactonase
MTNAADKNEIIAYQRSVDGSLQEDRSFRTDGRGSGGVTDPLGSQGSLTLSEDHSLLFAVNAGSGDISVFRVDGAKLFLTDKVPCGGSEPVAVAQHGSLVYVVNAGAASNVVGFRLDEAGKLEQIPDSLAFLSTGSAGASSLAISPDGQFVLVTEKLTNRIDAFQVRTNGTLAPIVVNSSVGPGLFSLLFEPNGTALATETGPAGGSNASAISSYPSTPAELFPRSARAYLRQVLRRAGMRLLPDGHFVFTSNAGSATISGFVMGASGSLTPVGGTIVGINPAGSSNLDIAISADGKFLYTLDSGTGKVSVFGITQDGTLNNLGEVGGLTASAGFNGIAAI